MKKSYFFLIISLLLQFTFSSHCFSADKNAVIKYNALLKQAKNGNPKSMFLLARMLEHGKGAQKNINNASKWYQRSASQNYAAANARLGKMYLEGIGVKKNIKKAFGLLNLAAIQGIPVAQFNLAILYELGVGTTQDRQEAIKWYDYAAKGGYYSAISKSNELRKKLGINSRSTAVVEPSIINDINTEEPKNITQQDNKMTNEDTFNQDELAVEIEKKIEKKTELKLNPKIQNQTTKISEQQTLFGNTLNQEQEKPNKAQININKLNTKQKLQLIKNENIKRTLQTLLDGRWFDKNSPVNFLPSPKTQCNITNKSDIKCISRQLQRHTDKETVFYRTLSNITELTSSGSFLIQYQNTVIRVVADRVVDEDGILFQSKIKTGLQQKIHELNCQYKNIKNLLCTKNNSSSYFYVNRAIIEKAP